ncbi:MAG: nitrite reductase large subunit NirB [Candidatus Pristimantibacillus sp.]
MNKQKLVMVGNGMAGMKCIEQVYELAPDAFDITILGAETHPNYNRILLSKVLQGDTSIHDITINDWQWYKDRGIHLFAGETVIRVNKESKQVETASGLTITYDHLILATGSSPFMPPIPGIDKQGVTAFRNMEDCRTMIRASQKYQRAAVIGGGLLGLEAARGLLNLGMEVDVVHNAPYLMNRQLDKKAADLLKKQLMSQGMKFWMEKRTEKIIGRKRAEGLQFSDGTRLAADLIVLAVGISPNTAVAVASEIGTNRAIVVNDYMETDTPDVYAVGECAEHRETVYGLVAPLYEQGKVLAHRLCGKATEPYRGSVPYAQLKVSGVEVFSAGVIRDGAAETALQHFDGIKGTYKKITMSAGKIVGAVLFGDSTEGTKLLGYLKKSSDVSVLQSEGPSSTPTNAHVGMAALANDDIICSCNGVSKAVIVSSVRNDGLRTVEQVRERTKASGSCGGCAPMVSALISYAMSVEETKEATVSIVSMCECTELDHEEVKSVIHERQSIDIADTMKGLGWKQLNGCDVCRSAIHYYMSLCELERLDISSEAEGYRESYATTYIGSSVSKLQGHKRIGLALQQQLMNLCMPHPIIVAISAGSMYPTGTLVNDFGITRVPAGWEIYAGGHSENPVRQGKLISVERSEKDALSMTAACIQLYRESAHYGEPAWKWLERLGLQRLREKLFDTDERMELNFRLGRAATTSKLTLLMDERSGS